MLTAALGARRDHGVLSRWQRRNRGPERGSDFPKGLTVISGRARAGAAPDPERGGWQGGTALFPVGLWMLAVGAAQSLPEVTLDYLLSHALLLGISRARACAIFFLN